MKSTEQLLEELHEETVKDLLNKIKSGEATASELSVAVKMLKDNGIEANRVPDSPLDNLVKNLPHFVEGDNRVNN